MLRWHPGMPQRRESIKIASRRKAAEKSGRAKTTSKSRMQHFPPRESDEAEFVIDSPTAHRGEIGRPRQRQAQRRIDRVSICEDNQACDAPVLVCTNQPGASHDGQDRSYCRQCDRNAPNQARQGQTPQWLVCQCEGEWQIAECMGSNGEGTPHKNDNIELKPYDFLSPWMRR